jgi:ribosomal-protein-alanine N-acetyltransferase
MGPGSRELATGLGCKGRGAERVRPPVSGDPHATPPGGAPELVLEVARTCDLTEIVAIERSSFPAPWSWKLFEQELEAPTSRVLVARLALEQGHPVVGYVCWSSVVGEIHLLNLAVHPERRRRSIGQRLVQAVIDAARASRAEVVYLEMRETNRAAAHLYRSAGFVRVGCRRDYYGRGEKAIVMALRLAGSAG